MKLMMRAIIDLPSKNTAWGNAFNFRQLSYQLTELHLGKNLYQKWIFIEIVSFMILWYLWQCFISTMFNSYLVFGLRWSWNRGLSFQCRRQLSTILKDSLWSSSLHLQCHLCGSHALLWRVNWVAKPCQGNTFMHRQQIYLLRCNKIYLWLSQETHSLKRFEQYWKGGKGQIWLCNFWQQGLISPDSEGVAKMVTLENICLIAFDTDF